MEESPAIPLEHLIVDGVYTFKPAREHSQATCMNCGSDVYYVMYGRIMVYKGYWDGCHRFEYIAPFMCPGCQTWFITHTDTGQMDVTEEFRKLLDKK